MDKTGVPVPGDVRPVTADVVEGDGPGPDAAANGLAAAGVVDQDPLHGDGRGAKEAAAVGEGGVPRQHRREF